MSNQLSAATSANMENARKADGKFGNQVHSVNPAVVLAPAITQERLDTAGTAMLQRTAVSQAESLLFFRHKSHSPFDRPVESYEDDVELAADINNMFATEKTRLLVRLRMTRFAGLSEP